MKLVPSVPSSLPPSPLPAAALVLGRKLVTSLLANAFLCTFPEKLTDKHESELLPFNFDQFFDSFLHAE